MAESQLPVPDKDCFSFLKGGENVIAPKDGNPFDWEKAAAKVREHLNDAMNARHVAFLLGSGCSSFHKNEKQVGISTMMPMATAFLKTVGQDGDLEFVTQVERDALVLHLGLDVNADEFAKNLERLWEVLYCVQFILKSTKKEFKDKADHADDVSTTVTNIIAKITRHIVKSCSAGEFSTSDESVMNLYQAFYRKLVYRDRALPRPWIFTTNYDLFNETAMDRLGTPYSNGFSGTVERRFNPATFRYSLAEQLDVSSRKWTSVDSYVYLCKLHGSINWIEEGKSLFPIREIHRQIDDGKDRVMIFPTPAKQKASIGYPYSDLFREFQARIVRDQSVLFVLGYSFGGHCGQADRSGIEPTNNLAEQAIRFVAIHRRIMQGTRSPAGQTGCERIWTIIATCEQHFHSLFHYLCDTVQQYLSGQPLRSLVPTTESS